MGVVNVNNGNMLGLGSDTMIYFIDPNYVIMDENGNGMKRTLLVHRSPGPFDETIINTILRRQQLSLKGESFTRDDGLLAQEVEWSDPV